MLGLPINLFGDFLRWFFASYRLVKARLMLVSVTDLELELVLIPRVYLIEGKDCCTNFIHHILFLNTDKISCFFKYRKRGGGKRKDKGEKT